MPAISTLLDAIFGTRCALCLKLGASCCRHCLERLVFAPREVIRFRPDGTVLRGFAAVDFDATVGALVRSFKDEGGSAIAPVFAEIMARLPMSFGEGSPAPRDGRAATPTGAPGDGQAATPTYLVAVPSRISSIQQRGFIPAALIARALLNRLEPRWGSTADPFAPRYRLMNGAVWRAIESADQALLGQSERKQNLHNTMLASPKVRGKRVILVDDIVTTGASLFETARALEAQGARVLGFITFAETILKKIAKMPASETKRV